MIADVFIKRPVTAIVVSVVITLVGILSLMSLPISQYPDITPPIVQVTGNFVGADAQTVERTVATPIESQVNGSPGMAFLQTNSTSDGTMTMNVTFGVGTNIDIATLDVQNRVSVATPQLPDDVKRTGLTVKKRNPSILMLVAMYSPKGTHDIKFMDNYTNVYIKDALLRVKEKYGEKLPSLITFATGPSRTADIEKTLVVGVHGPKEVYCFLVDA